jgi:hypothetical protein
LSDNKSQEEKTEPVESKPPPNAIGTPKSKKQRTEKPSATTTTTPSTVAQMTDSVTNNTNATMTNVNNSTTISSISSMDINPSETEESKELREFFVGMFKKYGVCSILFLKQHFNKKLKEGMTLISFVYNHRTIIRGIKSFEIVV